MSPMNHNIRDKINMPPSMEDSVSQPIKNWPLGMNLNNTNTSISSQVPEATTQDEPNSNTAALWMKRLGMMIGGNAGLKDEIHQSPTESKSQPTRRLSIEDVQNVLRNIKAEAVSARLSNNSSSSDPKSSILKSSGVYSQAIDNDLNPEEEATNNTVYMLGLLMMLDSYRDGDRVKLGLPASDRAPNSLTFKADSSSGMDVAKGPRVNAQKQEERGGEGEVCGLHPRDSCLVREEPNEGHPPVQPQADLSALSNEDRPVQPQSNLSAALLGYKPRRARSSSSIDSKDNSPNTSESLSDPLQALQTLEILAQRASHGTATTQGTADSDSQEHTSPDAAMMKYKPKRKNAPPGASAPHVVPDAVFGSFTTMTSTGTFKDAQKRSVPTTLNTRNDSSSKLRGKASRNDDTTSPLNSTLSSSDIFPSTGTFKDVAKRHVPRVTNANTPGGLQNARNDSWGKFKATKSTGNNATSVPLSNTLEKNSIFPSTGTFRDVAKRQVRTVRPEQNQEWDIEPKTMAAMPSRSSGNLPMWGFNTNNPNAGSNKEVRVNSRQDQQQNTDEGNVSEPEKPKNIFQRYMENKAKLLQQKPSTNPEAVIPPKTAEVQKPAAKSELLVDWGDQGTDSEEEEEEEEENNGIITFVKNDSSRRISDITIQDEFDSDEEDMLDISCKEMRERIRSLSIAEDLEWNQNNDCEERNEGQNNAYFIDAEEDEGLDAEAEDIGLSPPVLFRSESERTSASHETVKTSTRKSDDNIIVDTKIKSVEMGKGLIRNMSAITLHEFSDEELDTLSLI